LVDQHSTQSSLLGTNKLLVSNSLEQENAIETMQPTTSQMTHVGQDSTVDMVPQQSHENRHGQQDPHFNLDWNLVPKMQRQQIRRKMKHPHKNQHHKDLTSQNMFNQFSLEDKKNHNSGFKKQDIYNNRHLNNDPRLQNTQSNMYDKNNYNGSYMNMNQNTFPSSPTNAF
jgi:hypothetical protein